MGSGVSAEVVSLVDIIRLDNNTSCDKRDDIKLEDTLKKLLEKSDVVENKAPMSSSELGLLKELAIIIKENKGETRLLATKCLWYLSRDGIAKLNISDSKINVIETIVDTANECFHKTNVTDGKLLGAIIIILSNCTLIEQSLIRLYSSKFKLISLSKQLLMVSSKEIVFCSLRLLSNIFDYPSSAWLVPLYLSENVLDNIIQVLTIANNDTSSAWADGISYGSWCLTFIYKFCFHRDAAMYVKNISGINELLHSIEKNIHRHYDKIQYFLIMTLIYGNDEVVISDVSVNSNEKKKQQSILASNTSILSDLITVFKNTIAGKGGDGYDFGLFKIPSIVNAIRVLAISDNNKQIMITYSDLLDLLIHVMKRFADNEPPYSGYNSFKTLSFAGGGGDDIMTIEMTIETVCQLSYVYELDDDLINKYLLPKLQINQYIQDLLDTNKLSDGTKGLLFSLQIRINPQKKIIHNHHSIIESNINSNGNNDIDNNITVNPISKHIMISYSWKVGKTLVESLQKQLQKLGYDVWRDETGSNIVSSMQGDVIEKMAEAIECAHTVIICVSRWYFISYELYIL